MSTHTLPSPFEVGKVLGGLLDKKVGAKEGAAAKDGDIATIAVMHNGQGSTIGVVLADWSFSARAGAALSLLPADVAADCAKDHDLTKVMKENIYEVMNVASVLFQPAPGEVSRLGRVFHHPDAPADDVKAFLASGTRQNLTMEIEGYGVGVLSLVVAP